MPNLFNINGFARLRNYMSKMTVDVLIAIAHLCMPPGSDLISSSRADQVRCHKQYIECFKNSPEHTTGDTLAQCVLDRK